MKNAESYKTSGASILFNDSQLAGVNLLDEAVRLFENGERDRMASAVAAMRYKKSRSAADLITDEILELINIRESSS